MKTETTKRFTFQSEDIGFTALNGRDILFQIGTVDPIRLTPYRLLNLINEFKELINYLEAEYTNWAIPGTLHDKQMESPRCDDEKDSPF
jgi:hypothetical protein